VGTESRPFYRKNQVSLCGKKNRAAPGTQGR